MDPYISIADLADDRALQRRITACMAQDGVARPEDEAYAARWAIAAQPGWGAAWASAQAAGRPDIGAQPDVISDGMILAAVQAVSLAG